MKLNAKIGGLSCVKMFWGELFDLQEIKIKSRTLPALKQDKTP